VRRPRIRWERTLILPLGGWLMLGSLAASRLLPGAESEDGQPAVAVMHEPPIAAADREHWAFQPLAWQPWPAIRQRAWPRVGFDHFVLADLEKIGLAPAPEAQATDWLRRLKLDLIGLPPTAEEVTEFLADTSPEAEGRWVDRFLASPQYGERWAQLWLDLARFAETDGFEHDRIRPEAWRYRDWVIRAWNEDRDYRDFIRQQLAGDLSADTSEAVATMFVLAGPDMPDINDQALRRHDRLNELTGTVGAALMGLQFQCAQCHDHKYDPLSQADFYRFRAIFESAIPELKRDQPWVLLASSHAKPALEPRFYGRGELRQAGPVVRPAFPRILSGAEEQPAYCKNPHPRMEFAAWLFQDNAALTARVMVNRLWQAHFGRGLFEQPSDVGVTAGEPTNRAVLDWLAEEFQRRDWSLKAIQRMIVLSATYRQASRGMPLDEGWARRLDLDPDNLRYSRFPRQRLDAERIRDSLLSVSGLIHAEGGGPGVMPPLPEEMVRTLLKGQWNTSSSPADHARRSIYIFARRNLRYPLLEVFDRPDAGASCARRDTSTTAPQALQMLNSDFTWQCSVALRQRVLRELVVDPSLPFGAIESSIPALAKELLLSSLGRLPDPEEGRWLAEFLAKDGGQGWNDRLLSVCRALLNTNELITLD
jgi:hypothetical protein